jgi:hypothetical protein
MEYWSNGVLNFEIRFSFPSTPTLQYSNLQERSADGIR